KKFVRGFEIDKRSGYTIVDIIRVLRILHGGPMGRVRLIKEIGLGEATVKTMIKRLKNDGILTDSTRGQILTGIGREIAEEINEKVSIFHNFKIPTITRKTCTTFIVRNSAGKVKMGIEQRDEGMKLGVNVTTLVYDGKDVRFPGTGEIFRDLDGKLNLKRGDVIIISSGEGKERGGFAAVLTLI
ncbi:MAG: DUF4443 domain-containing protein, partial [Candidatus Aenigmarchaeota archaeon]